MTQTEPDANNRDTQLAITTIIIAITAAVGAVVFEKMMNAQFQNQEIDAYCLGVFGCNGIQAHELGMLVLILGIPVVTAVVLRARHRLRGGGEIDA